ncbi:hypothetical protein IE077_000414 [Cardiosporidium cionae]|uniref:OTU domain-containing protein n=1 Tax=Cardiosporidium cionae TaxID=476202 RepID=A0ABQ7J9U2_9APIC|nr:hypothetical protein IE077_000414 [Cardiosporidium cionae]|eukprot:KAF8820772.1 hypothetical protein IE077_000414 [Cardiosporidium cionae]
MLPRYKSELFILQEICHSSRFHFLSAFRRFSQSLLFVLVFFILFMSAEWNSMFLDFTNVKPNSNVPTRKALFAEATVVGKKSSSSGQINEGSGVDQYPAPSRLSMRHVDFPSLENANTMLNRQYEMVEKNSPMDSPVPREPLWDSNSIDNLLTSAKDDIPSTSKDHGLDDGYDYTVLHTVDDVQITGVKNERVSLNEGIYDNYRKDEEESMKNEGASLNEGIYDNYRKDEEEDVDRIVEALDEIKVVDAALLDEMFPVVTNQDLYPMGIHNSRIKTARIATTNNNATSKQQVSSSLKSCLRKRPSKYMSEDESRNNSSSLAKVSKQMLEGAGKALLACASEFFETREDREEKRQRKMKYQYWDRRNPYLRDYDVPRCTLLDYGWQEMPKNWYMRARKNRARLCLKEVDSDGDCMFSAIAIGIKKAGIKKADNTHYTVSDLRKIAAVTLAGFNPQKYESLCLEEWNRDRFYETATVFLSMESAEDWPDMWIPSQLFGESCTFTPEGTVEHVFNSFRKSQELVSCLSQMGNMHWGTAFDLEALEDYFNIGFILLDGSSAKVYNYGVQKKKRPKYMMLYYTGYNHFQRVGIVVKGKANIFGISSHRIQYIFDAHMIPSFILKCYRMDLGKAIAGHDFEIDSAFDLDFDSEEDAFFGDARTKPGVSFCLDRNEIKIISPAEENYVPDKVTPVFKAVDRTPAKKDIIIVTDHVD